MGFKLEIRLDRSAGIIRNRLKVNAAIENAGRILEIQEKYGSFSAWLDLHHPLEIVDWQKLFKKTFVFTGGEIVRGVLTSTGYLVGAHDSDCSVFQEILKLELAWSRLPTVGTADASV